MNMKRKAQREELKQIESILHPCPVINGIKILHEHRGQKIIFTAWKGGERINSKGIDYERWYVLSTPQFYQEELQNLGYLVEG